jgi:PAS domain S-box-containing protein
LQGPWAKPGTGDKDTRLLSMAEAIGNMGHWHWQVANDAMSLSDQVSHILGVDAGPATHSLSSILAFYHPDERAKVQAFVELALTKAEAFEFDSRIVRPNGEVRAVIVKGQPECANGMTVAIFGVITDVTEAFAAINAIQDQHEMLDLAAQLAQLGHWVWSADRRIISFCSENLARIHGVSVSVFLARFTNPEHFANAIRWSDRARYRAVVAAAMERGQPYSIEYNLVTPDDHEKDIREIGHPLFNRDGTLARFVGTVQDITEAKRRENALERASEALKVQAEAQRRSEAKLRGIVDGSIQGILVLRGLKPVFANRAFARMMGLPSAEDVLALGDVRGLLLPDCADFDAFWKRLCAGDLDGTTYRAAMRTVDGRTLWTDAVGGMIEWEGEGAVLMSVVDVTQRHLAEQELLMKSRQLQELNLQKDKLFSIIAHDLKAPFNSVIGFSDLLVSCAGGLDADKVIDYARLVRDSAITVHGLFDNLLSWAAFQLRDAQLRLSPVNLAEATRDSIEPLLPMATEKNVSIDNAIAESTADIHVLADADMLRIVLRNIVSNGIKFSHEGGTVRISAAAAEMVRISVRDRGIGMSDADIANLFRLDAKTSRPGTLGEKGTGLGLYLCHDIVARHHGTITAECVSGEGCTFHVLLPRAAPSAGG